MNLLLLLSLGLVIPVAVWCATSAAFSASYLSKEFKACNAIARRDITVAADLRTALDACKTAYSEAKKNRTSVIKSERVSTKTDRKAAKTTKKDCYTNAETARKLNEATLCNSVLRFTSGNDTALCSDLSGKALRDANNDYKKLSTSQTQLAEYKKTEKADRKACRKTFRSTKKSIKSG